MNNLESWVLVKRSNSDDISSSGRKEITTFLCRDWKPIKQPLKLKALALSFSQKRGEHSHFPWNKRTATCQENSSALQYREVNHGSGWRNSACSSAGRWQYIYIPYNKAYTQGFLKDFSLGRQENLALVPQTNKSSSLGKGSAKSGIQPAMRKNRIITSCIRSKTAQGKLINSLASLIRVILLTSYCAPSNAGVWHITEVFSFLKVVKCSAEHAVLSVLLWMLAIADAEPTRQNNFSLM